MTKSISKAHCVKYNDLIVQLHVQHDRERRRGLDDKVLGVEELSYLGPMSVHHTRVADDREQTEVLFELVDPVLDRLHTSPWDGTIVEHLDQLEVRPVRLLDQQCRHNMITLRRSRVDYDSNFAKEQLVFPTCTVR